MTQEIPDRRETMHASHPQTHDRAEKTVFGGDKKYMYFYFPFCQMKLHLKLNFENFGGWVHYRHGLFFSVSSRASSSQRHAAALSLFTGLAAAGRATGRASAGTMTSHKAHSD